MFFLESITTLKYLKKSTSLLLGHLQCGMYNLDTAEPTFYVSAECSITDCIPLGKL